MKLTMRATALWKKVTLITTAFVLAVSSLTAAVPFVLSKNASALGGVHTTNLSTWDTSLTRANGHNELVSNGLHVWTDGSADTGPRTDGVSGTWNTDKAAGYYPTSLNLSAATDFVLNWTGTVKRPGGQLVVDLNNNGIKDGILVVEPNDYGNNVWLAESGWAAADGIDLSTLPTVGGGGGPYNGSYGDWLALFPDAKVTQIGYSLGSGVFANGVITKITVGGAEYTFERLAPINVYVDDNYTAVSAGGHTWGYDAFAHIQEGIDAVGVNGTVHLKDGTYNEKVTFTKSNVTLVGESKAGTIIKPISNDYGMGITTEGASNVTISKLTVNANAASGGSAVKFSNSSNITLSNALITGNNTYMRGVDINGVDGVTLNNVKVNSFGKNGIAITGKYNAAGAFTTRDVLLTDVSSTSNGWFGVVFYNLSSTNFGTDINNVRFNGINNFSSNGQYGFGVIGNTDANFLSGVTPAYKITGANGALVNLGTTTFAGNGLGDIVNYQTTDLLAAGATINGKLGSAMSPAEIAAAQLKIVDKNDNASYGRVVLDTTIPTGTLSYSPNTWTNGTGVTVTLTTNKPIVQSALTGTWLKVNDTTFKKVYPSNVTQVNTLKDYFGNTSTVTVAVNQIDRTAPAKPVNGAPGITNTNDFYFTWDSVSPAGGSPVVEYQFQSSGSSDVDSNGSLVNPWKNWQNYVSPEQQFLATPMIHSTGASDGTYYWQVRAIDQAGNVGAWSQVWTAKIDSVTPTAEFIFPTAGPSATSFQVKFNEAVNETDATNAANYFLENWPGAGGSGDLTGDANVTYDAGTKTATVTFTNGGWYVSPEQKWVVKNVRDLAGNPIADTSAYSTPLVKPVFLSNPAGTSSANSSTQTFEWFAVDPNNSTDASGIKGYEYALVSAGATPTSWTFTTASSVTFTGLADGTYRLYVRIIDNAGNVSTEEYSQAIVDTTPPAAEILSFSAGRVAGTADPDATLVVTIDGVDSNEFTPESDGTWEYFITPGLATGNHTASVKAKDGVGNEFTPAVKSLAIAAPVVSVLNTGTSDDGGDDTNNEAGTVQFPSAAGLRSVLGVDDSSNTGDDTTQGTEGVEGTSTEKNLAAAVDTDSSDGTVLGMAWYWWLLILAAIATIIWWIIATLRNRAAQN